MIRITAPYFVAAVIIGPGGFVIRAAPIIKYMVGWDQENVRAYCAKKGWACEDI